MKIEIYAIYNDINGKIYVGQTRQGYKKRFKQHLDKSSECRAMKNAVLKYGKNAFHIELLDIAESQEEANNLEKMWIRALKSYIPQNGYNLSMGGKIGDFNAEVLKRMSESHRGEKNFFYGKHHSEEQKKKWRTERKGKYSYSNHPRARKVLCVETGKIYDCIKEAAEDTKANRHHISQVCLKQKGRTTSGGYHWEYV